MNQDNRTMAQRNIEAIVKKERASTWQEAERYYANLVVQAFQPLTSGDLEDCLDLARQEFEMSADVFWLRVRDGLLYKLKRRANPLFAPPDQPDDELPF